MKNGKKWQKTTVFLLKKIPVRGTSCYVISSAYVKNPISFSYEDHHTKFYLAELGQPLH